MKTIAVFKSQSFDLSWPKDTADPNAVPLGKDLALHLRIQLMSKGLEVSEPIQGSDYWALDLKVETVRYSLSIHWAPMGKPPEDMWVVQPQLNRGILTTMFGNRAIPEKLTPICSVLHEVIDGHSDITDLKWLDEDQFRKEY